MGHMLAVVVGADQGANQQHRCPRSPHETGQHGANGQDGRVEPRAAMQVAADVDATRHRKQRGEQNDEGNVFGQQRMHEAGAGHPGAKHHGKRHQKRQPPGRRHLAKMVVPENGGKQGHQRNRQQQAGKRHAPQHRNAAAIKVGGKGQARQREQGDRGQPA